MNTYRKWFDPGGHQLAGRLEQLRDTFNDLAGRLRSTVATVVGNAFGAFVQDIVLQTLHGLSASSDRPALPGPENRSHERHRNGPCADGDTYGQPALLSNNHDGDSWADEWLEGEEDPGPSQPQLPSPSVSVIVVAAGLQAASLWLRYWQGSRKLLTTLGVGVLTGGVAFAIPSLATSILNLAGSALQIGALATFPTNAVQSIGLT